MSARMNRPQLKAGFSAPGNVRFPEPREYGLVCNRSQPLPANLVQREADPVLAKGRGMVRADIDW